MTRSPPAPAPGPDPPGGHRRTFAVAAASPFFWVAACLDAPVRPARQPPRSGSPPTTSSSTTSGCSSALGDPPSSRARAVRRPAPRTGRPTSPAPATASTPESPLAVPRPKRRAAARPPAPCSLTSARSASSPARHGYRPCASSCSRPPPPSSPDPSAFHDNTTTRLAGQKPASLEPLAPRRILAQ